MDAELKAYLEGMEARLREEFRARLGRAAEAAATDVGHVHSEVQALHARVRKMDTNVTTCIELLTRQSRWHGETDANALELLTRVNQLERRVIELEQGREGTPGGAGN